MLGNVGTIAKSDVLGPVMLMPETDSAAVPVLLMVTNTAPRLLACACVGTVVPTGALPKLTLEGLGEKAGVFCDDVVDASVNVSR